MLIIRLTKVGKKNSPSFRVILTQKTAAAKSGKFLEILGHYNPRQVKEENGQKKKEIKLDAERIKYWLSQGAQTSETVHNLLVSEKVIVGEKRKKKIRAKASEKSPDVSRSKIGTPTEASEKSGSRPEGAEKEEPVEEKATEEKTTEETAPVGEKAEEKKEDKKPASDEKPESEKPKEKAPEKETKPSKAEEKSRPEGVGIDKSQNQE